MAAGVFQAKIKTVTCSIGGLVLDKQDNGYYYTMYYPPIGDSATILNISSGNWSGNVFFQIENFSSIVIKSATSYTMPSGRYIQVTYIV